MRSGPRTRGRWDEGFAYDQCLNWAIDPSRFKGNDNNGKTSCPKDGPACTIKQASWTSTGAWGGVFNWAFQAQVPDIVKQNEHTTNPGRYKNANFQLKSLYSGCYFAHFESQKNKNKCFDKCDEYDGAG